ncbi:type IV toxin-antitoxin system AbiEi family antitoxin [Prosthecobacter sp.]|uniref:type IV toxin-antitoxin system AbiEi family antitoxin n=1 Tax=Prosthecobacter sp. TaxID=1965333 RepID=UPI001D6F0E8D|nr:type IV toxin-antitoxin system AbiEi family antitoxin [Prosthecobacter sp.]MCB1276443.1 hypothetical protein [Prosthecobacter sp.]
MDKIVNKGLRSASALEKALGEQIQRLLRGISWLEGVKAHHNPAPFHRAFDWLVEFKVPGGPTVELWIDCRAEPRPAQFPYVSMEREFEQQKTKLIRRRVFAAPNLSPRMREICETHGWAWYDLAGNCRITVPGVIHLERIGNAPVRRPQKPGANLSTREAGRVIRALLTPFYAGHRWTQHLIRQQIELHGSPKVSVGLVNKVVRHLLDEAFIEPLEDRGFRLADPLKLLFAWRDAYRFDQHQRRGYFTLLQGRQLRDALASLDAFTGGFAAYASFSAADFQAPHVRQPKTWLYVASHELERFAETVKAKPVDSGENLVVLVPADDGVFFHPDGGNSNEHHLRCTNLVQTYVDLWHSSGRGQEAAEALLNQRLIPIWKAAGLKI